MRALSHSALPLAGMAHPFVVPVGMRRVAMPMLALALGDRWALRQRVRQACA